MATENSTRVVITAEDRTAGALASVTRGLGGMQAEALRASAALSAIGFTAAAAGAARYVRSIIDTADETQKLSQRIGIATKDIAGWKLAADLSGASLESVAKGIKGLSTYSAEYGDTLRQVGIDTRDPQRALTQLADLFAALSDGLQKTALATTLFGKAGLDMIPMLNQGSRALEEQRKKAEEYGRKMAEIGPDAEKFNDNLEETAFYAKAAGTNIAAYFLPGLAGLSKLLVDVAKGGDDAYMAMEWLWGERIAKGAALLHSERFGKGLKRESGGKIGGAAGGMSPAGEEALAAQNVAGMQAADIIARAKGSAGGKGGSSPLDRMLEQQKKRIAEMNAMAGDEQMASVDTVSRQLDKALADKAQAMDEAHQARMEAYRIETEGEEAQRVATEKLNAELAKQKDMAQDLGLTFASAFEDAIVGGKGLQQVLQGLVQDVSRIFVRKTLTEPLGNSLSKMFGSFDIGNLFGSSGGSSGSFDWMPSFAGGGSTGNGARSGGLDGKGGFLAMLHPRESVIDHASGGDGGGAVTIQLNFAVGIAQTVRAEVMAMMPQIQAATTAGMIDARRRGGAVRKAFAG